MNFVLLSYFSLVLSLFSISLLKIINNILYDNFLLL